MLHPASQRALRPASIWTLAAIGLAALGCEPRTGREAQPPEASGGGPVESGEPADVTEQMRGQFADGVELHDALVTGRVAVVNEVASRFVARHREQPFPERWQAQLEPLLEWAQAAATAEDFETAAIAVANVSARCGECHVTEGVQLELPTPVEPDSTAQMQRYRFAVDRMWEGLVAPDDERWQLGAQAYVDAVDCKPIGPGSAVAEHHTVPCNSILAVAGAAQSAQTLQARADSFAAVTLGCAGCHGVESPAG